MNGLLMLVVVATRLVLGGLAYVPSHDPSFESGSQIKVVYTGATLYCTVDPGIGENGWPEKYGIFYTGSPSPETMKDCTMPLDKAQGAYAQYFWIPSVGAQEIELTCSEDLIPAYPATSCSFLD